MIFVIIGIIIVLGVLLKLYKIRTADTIENEARDLAKKEKVLKVAIFKDAYNLLLADKIPEDKASTIAAGVIMLSFNQDLQDLKYPIAQEIIIESCWRIFDEMPDIKEIVITYLRTKYVIYAGMTGELFYDLDSPTGELMVKYGSQVPNINDTHDFWKVFNKFMEKRWE